MTHRQLWVVPLLAIVGSAPVASAQNDCAMPMFIYVTPLSLPVKAEKLTNDLVGRALEPRLRSACGALTHDVSRAHWTITVVSAAGALQLSITDAKGLEYFKTTLPAKDRTARDLAHTIALIASEALAPLLPSVAAVGEMPTPPPPPPQSAPSAVPSPTPSHLQAGLHLAAQLGVPKDPVLVGGGISVDYRDPLLLLSAQFSVLQPRSQKGTDYRVNQTPGSLVLGAGVHRQWSTLDVGVVVGPLFRTSVSRASGTDVTSRRWLVVDWGVGASAVVDMAPRQLGGVHIRLYGGIGRLVGVGHLVVDGERVVSLGRMSYQLGAGAAWAFW